MAKSYKLTQANEYAKP